MRSALICISALTLAALSIVPNLMVSIARENDAAADHIHFSTATEEIVGPRESPTPFRKLSEEERTVLSYFEAARNGDSKRIEELVDLEFYNLKALEETRARTKKSQVMDSPRSLGSELLGPLLLEDTPKVIKLGGLRVTETERRVIEIGVTVVKVQMTGKDENYSWLPEYFSLHKSSDEGWKIYDLTGFDRWGFDSKER
ncbi:MAG: hypothetical protein IPM63_00320 [Acidobacteriota bacterium]|nr:MAG: hypothetical protein IPM63_00320 [Acidobacteriota bacterium]